MELVWDQRTLALWLALSTFLGSLSDSQSHVSHPQREVGAASGGLDDGAFTSLYSTAMNRRALQFRCYRMSLTWLVLYRKDL